MYVVNGLLTQVDINSRVTVLSISEHSELEM